MTPDDAELYGKHADELMRFASAVAGPSAAEDVVASAVLRTFSSPGWHRVTERRAYLYRAVLNQARQEGRTSERRVRRERRLAAAGDSVEGADGYGTVRPAVLAAMRRLSARQRAVLYLTYWLDLAPEAVGEQLAISTRTVSRELAAGRRRLEELLR